MTYQPPLHLAIVLSSKLAEDKDVAFWTEAVKIQLRDDAAPAWGLPPPGVFVYTPETFIPAKEGAMVALVDDDGNDDAAGLHSKYGDVAFGLVDLRQSSKPWRTLSHEALELWANAALDRWLPGPNGLEYAGELCDPVQREEYEIDVELFGERRAVAVSNFVWPAWFRPDLHDHSGPFDQCRTLGEPHELAPGGYAIARNPNGQIVYLSHKDGSFMEPRHTGKNARTRRLIESGRRA